MAFANIYGHRLVTSWTTLSPGVSGVVVNVQLNLKINLNRSYRRKTTACNEGWRNFARNASAITTGSCRKFCLTARKLGRTCDEIQRGNKFRLTATILRWKDVWLRRNAETTRRAHRHETEIATRQQGVADVDDERVQTTPFDSSRHMVEAVFMAIVTFFRVIITIDESSTVDCWER